MKKCLKVFLTIICIFLLMGLVSCSCKENSYEEYEHGIDITISDTMIPHLIYPNNLPVLHFDMDNVRVAPNTGNATRVFVRNDYRLLSEAWAAHLAIYQENQKMVLSTVEQTYDNGKAKFGSESLPLDDVDELGNPQKYSIECKMVAWATDGTRYSYQYRTFISNKVRYYIYCYTDNLTISMEQPLMVVGQEVGNNKLLLLALPYNTKYEVGVNNLTIDALLNKDTYCYDVHEDYYKFAYPDCLIGLTIEEQKAKVREWYETYCQGKDEYYTIENKIFTFIYAGGKYHVDFDVLKSDNKTPAFQIIYLGDA